MDDEDYAYGYIHMYLCMAYANKTRTVVGWSALKRSTNNSFLDNSHHTGTLTVL